MNEGITLLLHNCANLKKKMPDHPDPSSGKVHKKRNTLCIYININQVAHHHEFHTEHIRA